MPAIIQTYQAESFTFPPEIAQRSRPKKIVALLDTQPEKTTARSMGPYPIALKPNGVGSSDALPHNTVGGHLVGLNFGGPHADTNLVPMYGNFNNGGTWSQMEGALYNTLYANNTTGTATLTLELAYAGTDPRIPSSFNVKLEYKTTDGQQHTWTPTLNPIPHPSPVKEQYEVSQDLMYHLWKLDSAMKDAKWFVEDHVGTTWGPKHFRYGEPLIVPARDYAARPYAVLDYMVYGLRQFPEYAITLNNEAEFDDRQKNLIYQANIAFNNGYIVSNAKDDYVYDGQTDTLLSNYYASALSITGKQGHLVWGGGHQKPEVDHIVPKGDKFRGSNAYSNAQVTSSHYNNMKRQKTGSDNVVHLF